MAKSRFVVSKAVSYKGPRVYRLESMKTVMKSFNLPSILTSSLLIPGLILAGLAACRDAPPAVPAAERPASAVSAASAASDPSSAPVPSEPDGPSYVGVIVASESVNLSSELRGRLESVSVRPGDRVRKGAVLAEIQPLNLPEQIVSADAAVQMARSGVSQAETALRLARERVSRVEAAPDMFSAEQRSVAQGALETTGKELESSRSRLVQAESELQRLRGQSARRVLRAPTDGWVAARLLDPGALVEAGQTVVSLKRGDRSILRFAVPPAEAAHWPAGTKILWRPEGGDSAYPAAIARVAQQVDPASQMVFVEADLGASADGEPGLIRDGLVVRVVREAGRVPRS